MSRTQAFGSAVSRATIRHFGAAALMLGVAACSGHERAMPSASASPAAVESDVRVAAVLDDGWRTRIVALPATAAAGFEFDRAPPTPTIGGMLLRVEDDSRVELLLSGRVGGEAGASLTAIIPIEPEVARSLMLGGSE